ncbi:MAG TPA: hypothetical protein VEH04_16105 [Verrucomicrobiae bacterium]|nr:hypothetical protein [Verrucomicrobiae bacterium]
MALLPIQLPQPSLKLSPPQAGRSGAGKAVIPEGGQEKWAKTWELRGFIEIPSDEQISVLAFRRRLGILGLGIG